MGSYSITEQDYISAIKLSFPYTRKKLSSTIILLVVVAVLGFFAFQLNHGVLAAGLWGGCVGGIVGHWIQRIYCIHIGAKKIYKQQKTLHEAFTCSWSDDCLLVSGGSSSSKTPWHNYMRWRENDSVFLLYHSDALFQIIPKASFASEDALLDFKKHLEKIECA